MLYFCSVNLRKQSASFHQLPRRRLISVQEFIFQGKTFTSRRPPLYPQTKVPFVLAVRRDSAIMSGNS